VLFGFADVLLEIKPDVRTIAPVSRDNMRVLCTPGFWLSRVSRANVSSGWFIVRYDLQIVGQSQLTVC
jgi:hypothetical protein